MTIFYRTASLIIAIILLQGCGGSSSGNAQEKYQINSDINTVNFSSEVAQTSDDTIQVNVTFQGDGLLLGFAPDAQPPFILFSGDEKSTPWLEYTTENITSNSATIHINVANTERLPPDTYNTTLRISTGDITDVDLVHHDIEISLDMWQLSTDTNLVSFSGTLGDESIASQSFNYFNETSEWVVSADVDWLTLNVAPVVDSELITVTVTPDISGFTNSGLNQANILFTEVSSGEVKLIPVELGLDNIYLYANDENIAFTSTNNINATEQTITISTNSPTNINWQVSKDASWLTIIKNNDQLTITADESLLMDNELATATIDISAVDNGAIIAESIKVSFYKNKTDIVDQIIPNIAVNSNALISSPTLPYVYIGVANELQVYHLYTGELLGSVAVAPQDALLEQLVIHPNGETLLAKSEETRYKINITNNNDLHFSEITTSDISFEPLDFIRIQGRYFVITQALEYANENLTTQHVNSNDAFATNLINFSTTTDSLFAIDDNTVSIKRFNFILNDFVGEKITSVQTHNYQPELNVNNSQILGLSVSKNGNNIYIINELTEWLSFDGIAFIDNGLLNKNENTVSLALTADTTGKVHFSSGNPFDATFFINSYNSDTLLTTTLISSNNQPSSITVSADNNRAVVNSAISNNVEFITLH